MEHSAIPFTCIKAIIDLENQFSVVLRMAVLHRFYCTLVWLVGGQTDLSIFLVLHSVGLLCGDHRGQLIRCLFVCFIALRPKSTAMVMAGRSDHLTTLFPVQA